MGPVLQLFPLFLAAGILLAGNGLLITLITLRAQSEGFSPSLIGLLGTTYFAGFLFGALTATRLINKVGHIRVFAALAATASAGALLLVLVVDPYVWMFARAITGFCFAGLFAAIESWINGAASNTDRGRLLAIYSIVDLLAVTGSQLILPVLGTAGFTAFGVTAMLLSLSLVPIALSNRASPMIGETAKMGFLKVFEISPLAFIGCFVVGLTNSAFRTIGPLYAQDLGLDLAGVAVFMSAGIVGGAVLQLPLGWMSDRFGRRAIIMIATGGATVAGLLLTAFGQLRPEFPYLGALLFGAFAMPLYSLSVAHANDFAKDRQFAQISAGLLFTFAIGASVGPLMAALVVERYGTPAFFIYTSVAHGSLLAWALVRALARPTAPQRDWVRYAPLLRTSPAIFRLARRKMLDRPQNEQPDDTVAPPNGAGTQTSGPSQT